MTGVARADAWIPEEGSGYVEPMVRYSYSDQSFSPDYYSFNTYPSSNEQKTQLRIRGEHGLGGDFSLDYDFRYAFFSQSRTKDGVTESHAYSGLQEQRIGLNYGLSQDTNFADSIGLGVVIPGGSGVNSHLESGRWAMEPIYYIGFKPGFWNLTGNLDVASRVFLDGGATQFRSHLEIGAPIVNRVHLAGKLFFVRTVKMSAYDNPNDRGELYNVLRVGVEARYSLADGLEPVFAYEDEVAGMGSHAAQRLTFGLKITY
jgi:hypothetical protein